MLQVIKFDQYHDYVIIAIVEGPLINDPKGLIQEWLNFMFGSAPKDREKVRDLKVSDFRAFLVSKQYKVHVFTEVDFHIEVNFYQ